jgi:hypothetical protein
MNESLPRLTVLELKVMLAEAIFSTTCICAKAESVVSTMICLNLYGDVNGFARLKSRLNWARFLESSMPTIFKP